MQLPSPTTSSSIPVKVPPPPERALNQALRQASALRATRVVAAENYSAEICSTGRDQLFVWGRPGWMEKQREQLDSGRAGPRKTMPNRIQVTVSSTYKQSAELSFLSGSRHALFALTADGVLLYAQVYRNGRNVQDIELLPLKEMQGIVISQIATRFGQAYAVTPEGSVYAWGLKSGDPNRPDQSCSMGFGEVCTKLLPSLLTTFGPSVGQTPIRSVAAGVSHALFISHSGEVFSVGQSASGKLGLGAAASSSEHVMWPTKLSWGDDTAAPLVVQASAGASHSLFLASSGEVWGCGAGGAGALPTTEIPGNPEACFWAPTLLDRLPRFCSSLAAGISSSFFVGEVGEVYYCGKPRQAGKPFGRPRNHDPSYPFVIPNLKGIEQVSVSMELSFFQWEHVLFVHESGALLAWGHADHGEFLPGSDSRRSPRYEKNARNFYNQVVKING
jgi:alpha-tubulin suppressor-like RCC1 family protein